MEKTPTEVFAAAVHEGWAGRVGVIFLGSRRVCLRAEMAVRLRA